MILPQQYMVPYAISNAIALSLLIVAFKWPNVSRWGIAITYLWAAPFNSWIALTNPEQYQGFAELALVPWYCEFIEGPFGENATAFLLLIALGQAVIFITMALGGKYLRVGVIGNCIFLSAIAPLGVGSAFPFSIIVSIASIIVLLKLKPKNPAQ
ncbi:MAG: hypothetical protein KIT74_05075 [Fimbriimonadales bacterium]|nr:hypothetical protein [Fimbriimonadales bacterium]